MEAKKCKDCNCLIPISYGPPPIRCKDCKKVYRKAYRKRWYRKQCKNNNCVDCSSLIHESFLRCRKCNDIHKGGLRECIDCGTDISGYGWRSVRCRECQEIRTKASKNKIWENSYGFRTKIYEKRNSREIENTRNLSDSYIVRLFSHKNNEIPLKRSQITAALIKLKRRQLLARRMLYNK